MFKPTDPQRTIFRAEYLIGPQKAQLLEKTWAIVFRDRVLPLIDEGAFAGMYCPDNGAPNKSVQHLVALHLLKDECDLTDEEVIENFDWNVLWQVALDVDPNEAHTCRKTLHNFRERVMANKKGRELFNQITDGVARLGNIDFGKQRTDSTHIVSNMMMLNRLGLFVKTIEQFLSKLERIDRKLLDGLPNRFFERYIDRRGYFADSKSSQAMRRIEACAKDLWYLVDRFRGDSKISATKQYKHMARLFKEQCKVVDGEGAEEERVALKEAKSAKPEDKIPTNSMQSPSDEDATYGHKGKGYEAQLSETCSKDNPFQVITDVAVSDSCGSDQNETIPIIERLEEAGRKPREQYVDSGYVSVDNIKEAEQRGVDLKGPIAGGAEKDDRLHLHDFRFDDHGELIACPSGHSPLEVQREEKNDDWRIQYVFDRKKCQDCELASVCPLMREDVARQEDSDEKPRKLNNPKITTTEEDRIVAQRKQRQSTSEFKEDFKIRSGIEATGSELKRKHGCSKLRVRGRRRIELALFLKNAALNVKRCISYVLSGGELRPNFALATR